MGTKAGQPTHAHKGETLLLARVKRRVYGGVVTRMAIIKYVLSWLRVNMRIMSSSEASHKESQSLMRDWLIEWSDRYSSWAAWDDHPTCRGNNPHEAVAAWYANIFDDYGRTVHDTRVQVNDDVWVYYKYESGEGPYRVDPPETFD